MTSPKRVTVLCAFVALFSVLFANQAKAQVTNLDPNLFICSDTTNCGAHPNLVDPASFTVGVNSNSYTNADPMLLIVAAPNLTSGTGPTVSLPGTVTAYSGTQAFGLATSGGTGPTTAPDATMSSSDIFTVLGLTGADNSMHFTDMAAFDATLGVTASSFGLWVYAINLTLTKGGTSGFDFTDIPLGSFIVGYGCTTFSTTNKSCSGNDLASTPFTTSGAVVPEPASMLLFGTGLVMLGAKLRRRKSSTPTP